MSPIPPAHLATGDTQLTKEPSVIPDHQSLTEIATAVWESTIGMAVLDTAVDRDANPAPHVWRAVDISGGWHGTVLLCVPENTAKRAAAVMLDCAPEATTTIDAEEVVSELINMIGGNIKGLIPGKNRLSLPRAAGAEEIEASLAVPNLWFLLPECEFAMTLVPVADPGRPAPPAAEQT